jgi:hypothetical protein
MSKTMNLTEYLNQQDPVRMPHVTLEPTDYKEGATIRIPGHPSLTQVFITRKEFTDKFPSVYSEYVKKGDSTVLWTVDKDGNPKSMSCFHVVE